MIFERFIVGPLGTNCYLFGGEKTGEVLVVDPDVRAWSELKRFLRCHRIPQSQALGDKLWEGEELSPGALRARLSSCGGFKLKAVLATHGHFDHVGGVEELRKKTGAPFWIFEGAKEELAQSQKVARELFGLEGGQPPSPDWAPATSASFFAAHFHQRPQNFVALFVVFGCGEEGYCGQIFCRLVKLGLS